MSLKFPEWMQRLRPPAYGRKPPLILINGLAEQAETWYRNVRFWQRHFDVYLPNLLLYDGTGLHRRIDQELPISIDYLVEQLHRYLDEYVQRPPCHLVASSLGGKIAVEYAARYPDRVSRMVLICPSGMGDEEQLPIVEGVRRSDLQALVDSVFHNPRLADGRIVAYYRRQFANKKWRIGLLRTIRGTTHYCVRDRLPHVSQPTLLVAGREDKIVDPEEAEKAAGEMPHGHFLLLDKCGHAPHIERAWLMNRLVVHFLTHPHPSPKPPLAQLLLATPAAVG